MFKEFRDFVLRGNVDDILMQVIAALGGEPDFSALKFSIGEGEFRYGEFLTALVSFLIIAAAIFFLVVKPVNTLMARRKAGLEPEAEAVPEDVVLLGEIRDLLKAGSR
jgi:large conductance mechanosensitive channel